MKAFLWCSSKSVQNEKCLVAWHRVQKPSYLGGLGVLDLEIMGRALRTRWLWLKRTDSDQPWAQLPVQEDPTTEAFFKASITCVIGNGRNTIFWSDPWLDGECIISLAPDLLGTVSRRQQRQRMVATGLLNNEWI
jgi:hypothetical protein